MKLNKILNMLVISTLLTPTFSCNSIASSNLERYELFEGSRIHVDNNTEDGTGELLVNGNTLVNIVKQESPINLKVYPGDSYAHISADLKYPLKPNTKYTMYFDITSNAYSQYPFSSIVLGQGHEDTGHQLDQWSNRLYIDKDFILPSGTTNYTGFYKTTFTTSYRLGETSFDWIKFIGDKSSDYNTIIENIVIVEGETDAVDYFKGIKSVGEGSNGNNSLDVDIQNKNLFLGFDHSGFKMRQIPDDRVLIKEKNRLKFTTTGWNQGFYFDMYGDFKRGETLYMMDKVMCFDFVKETTSTGKTNTYSTDSLDQVHWTIQTDCTKIQFLFKNGIEAATHDITNFAVYKFQENSYIENQNKRISIPLNKPLRSLPNGVCDKIIKRNGEWYIERNIDSITLDGSEYWEIEPNGSSSTHRYFRTPQYVSHGYYPVNYNARKDFFNSDNYESETADNNWNSQETSPVNIDVNADRTVSIKATFTTVDELKNHLSLNPVNVIYQKNTPTYELLNVSLDIPLYPDDIYINSYSIIPANFSLTIDRVVNIATDMIALATSNPTLDNISQARYWANLINESSIKDILQGDLNSLTGIVDLKPIELKSVSANADLYIKPKNTLSLSLSTNHVTFEDVTGTEDMEKFNALDLTVKSTLPYDVKAVLAADISNKDKSSTLNPNVLTLKSSTQSSYQTFSSAGDEVVLLTNQPAGMNNIHGVDMKLNSSYFNKTDVYKTAIKFTVEQK